MRIVSKFHDYYDGVMALGQDDLLFVRQSQTLPFDEIEQRPTWKPLLELCQKQPWHRTHPLRQEQIHLNPGWILFAGTLYPYVHISGTDSNTVSERFFFTHEEFTTWMQKHQLLPRKKQPRYRGFGLHFTMSWSEFFQQWGSTQFQHWAQSERIPVLAWERGHKQMHVNPRLQDFQFFRCKDAYSAYQELFQFLSNLASPEKPTVEIEDRYRIEQHGFDRWSFRKPPSDA